MRAVLATSLGSVALTLLPFTLAAGAVALMLASSPARPAAPVSGGERVELEVLGVVPLEDDGSGILVLKDKRADTILPLAVGQPEALAILLRLQGAVAPRPLALDLLDQAIAALGGRVVEVEIGMLRRSAFRARIRVAQGQRLLAIDARPGDSIALALRCQAPIYAQRQVLADAGLSRSDLERLRRGHPGEGGSPGAEVRM